MPFLVLLWSLLAEQACEQCGGSVPADQVEQVQERPYGGVQHCKAN